MLEAVVVPPELLRSACPAVSVQEYLIACCQKSGPPPTLLGALASLGTQVGRDIFCIASALGALEPLATLRPGACDIVTVFDKTVEVPPAAIDAKGNITPSERKLIQICAPMGLALVVDTLRALPANLTAALAGSLTFKRLAVSSFSEGFCPPGEPADGDDMGTFQNIEHVLLRPESGFDVHAKNENPYSPALFHIHARMWATC